MVLQLTRLEKAHRLNQLIESVLLEYVVKNFGSVDQSK